MDTKLPQTPPDNQVSLGTLDAGPQMIKPITQELASSAPQTMICPACKRTVSALNNFCPNCGKKLPKIDIHISIAKQIYIYLISLIAPPFGIIYTFRYFRNPHAQVRVVGWVALILTVISCAVTIWYTVNIVNTISQDISKYSSVGY